MVGETVNGKWLSALLPVSRSASDGKEVIGVLAFEVAGLMSKVVNLWHSLSDREMTNTKAWIMKSVGVKMLVSDDECVLMELALSEILNNFESLAWSVARLSKKCKDPVYHGYEHFVHNPVQNYLQWLGWEYAWKKMERKVKKMDRFVAAMSLLSQELEVLAEREQTLRRMKVNREFHGVKLLEFHKKVMWQRQQVKNLRDMSPWNRNYDYVVRLLARSLFTILERIVIVFGNSHIPIENQQSDSLSPSMNTNNNHLTRSHSFSTVMQSSVQRRSRTNSYGFCPQPIESKPVLNSGFVIDKSKSKRKKKEQQVLQTCVPTKGWLVDCRVKNNDNMKTIDKLSLICRTKIYSKLSVKGRLKPGPSTLGDAALALHYANVIVLIEKMVSAPHLIDLETRDDLYNILPTTIRTALRGKLKWYAKSRHTTVREASIAMEWSMVLAQILEWLSPLAHNMIKWHSERNFEREQCASKKANVLLVQTLHFADQAKVEAVIVELLVGVHFVCSVDRESLCVRLRKNQLYNTYL